MLISAICLLLVGISLVLDAGYEVFTIKAKGSLGDLPLAESHKVQASDVELKKTLELEFNLRTNPKGKMNRVTFFILVLVFLLKLTEILFTLLAFMLTSSQYLAFRSFPLSTFSPIEAIFLILIEKQYRNLLIVIVRTLPRFLTLLTFLGIGVFLYTVLGHHFSLPYHNFP